MGVLKKEILVVDLENYKPLDSEFRRNSNPGDNADPIRNYYGLHQTDVPSSDLSNPSLAPSGRAGIKPGYNEPMEGSFQSQEYHMAGHEHDEDAARVNHENQVLDVNGGTELLRLEIKSPQLIQTALALQEEDELQLRQFLTLTPKLHGLDGNPVAFNIGEEEDFEEFDRIVQDKMMQSTLGRMNTSQELYDHTFVTPGPYTKKEIENSNVTLGAFYYDAEPKYNYYMENYEKIVSEDEVDVPDTLLPNIYAFVANAMQEPNNAQAHGDLQNRAIPDPIYKKLMTLDSRIEAAGSLVNQSDPSDRAKHDLVQATKMQEYLKRYYQAIKNADELGWLTDPKITSIVQDYKNSLFSGRSKALLSAALQGAGAFPMYNHISFSITKYTPSMDVLATHGIGTKLLARLESTPSALQPAQIIVRTNDIGVSSASRTLQSEGARLRDVGLLPRDNVSPLDSLATSADSMESEVVVRDITLDVDMLAGDESFNGVVYTSDRSEMRGDVIQTLVGNVAISEKFKETYLKVRRSYADILTGKPAYAEVLAYKIEKYSMIDPTAPDLISTSIIPNQPSFDVANFIDTQVRYDEPYKYIIKQIALVYGSKIVFSPAQLGQGPLQYEYGPRANERTFVWGRYDQRSREPGATAQVTVTPSLKIYEVPYFSTREMRIVVTPPSPPEVEFIPYRAVDNKLLININNSLDEYVDYPAELDEIDRINAMKVRNMQNDIYGGKIRFSGRTTGTEIESFIVYRTDVRPRGYSAFGRSKQVPISTSIEGLKSSGGSYLDTIEPNKKYYYMVRTVDVHGFRSNPSAVFEIEMVSNSGTIYPIIKTVELGPDNDGRMMSRPMRKFLQIKPSFLQTDAQMTVGAPGLTLQDLNSPDDIMNEDGNWNENFGSIVIGGAAQTVWRRSFKVRLTSKQTGRKLDLNMTFRLRRDKS